MPPAAEPLEQDDRHLLALPPQTTMGLSKKNHAIPPAAEPLDQGDCHLLALQQELQDLIQDELFTNEVIVDDKGISSPPFLSAISHKDYHATYKRAKDAFFKSSTFKVTFSDLPRFLERYKAHLPLIHDIHLLPDELGRFGRVCRGKRVHIDERILPEGDENILNDHDRFLRSLRHLELQMMCNHAQNLVRDFFDEAVKTARESGVGEGVLKVAVVIYAREWRRDLEWGFVVVTSSRFVTLCPVESERTFWTSEPTQKMEELFKFAMSAEVKQN